MSLQQFFLILAARWKVALAVLVLVVAATLAVTFVLPKKYTAAAAVIVDVKPDPIAGLMPSPLMQTYMATQVDIMKSERVARRVVKLLRMDENPASREQWMEAEGGRGSFEVWLANALARSLEVTPSRESNVVSIEYSGSDPRFVAAMANAFAKAYIDTALELKVEPARHYAGWFEGQAKQVRDEFEQAQRKLSDYQREHGIVAGDERLDIENGRLIELSSQLTAIQAQRADSLSRQTQASRQALDMLPEVQQNPLVQGLKADIARADAKLQEMEGQFGTNHPQLVQTRAEVASLRQKLQVEMQRVVGALTTAHKVNAQREAEVTQALAAQKQKVLELKQQRDEIAVLQRDVEAAQRAYEVVSQRLQQTSLESQNTQASVAVLNPAVEPSRPSSPKPMLNALAATFLGSLMGVAMALLLELINPRVRALEDVAEALQVPLLGSLKRRGPRNWTERLFERLSWPRRKMAAV